MPDKLLSVAIPTKNRSEYVIKFIELVGSFNDDRIELVVQDNSDDNSEISSFLDKYDREFVKYFYDNSPMDMVANSELAISHTTGKYVCFMGDDDLISAKLAEFVAEMDREGFESALFARGTSYYWPGIVHKVHRFPSLSIQKYKGIVYELDVKKEFRKFLAHGAMDMGYMPQLYHGVIRRDRLEEIKKVSGAYFPGPCPDMAVCAALAYVIRKHVYCDMPYILSGAAPRSAAALGAKHEHKNKIENVRTLPPDTAEKWETSVPKIWTGQTIYAESAIKAIKNMGHGNQLKYFNYAYFYAYFFVFSYEFRKMSKPLVKGLKFKDRVLYQKYKISLFCMRTRCFLRNFIFTRFPNSEYSWDNVKDSWEAEKIVDQKIRDISPKEMLKQINN